MSHSCAKQTSSVFLLLSLKNLRLILGEANIAPPKKLVFHHTHSNARRRKISRSTYRTRGTSRRNHSTGQYHVNKGQQDGPLCQKASKWRLIANCARDLQAIQINLLANTLPVLRNGRHVLQRCVLVVKARKWESLSAISYGFIVLVGSQVNYLDEIR